MIKNFKLIVIMMLLSLTSYGQGKIQFNGYTSFNQVVLSVDLQDNQRNNFGYWLVYPKYEHNFNNNSDRCSLGFGYAFNHIERIELIPTFNYGILMTEKNGSNSFEGTFTINYKIDKRWKIGVLSTLTQIHNKRNWKPFMYLGCSYKLK